MKRVWIDPGQYKDEEEFWNNVRHFEYDWEVFVSYYNLSDVITPEIIEKLKSNEEGLDLRVYFLYVCMNYLFPFCFYFIFLFNQNIVPLFTMFAENNQSIIFRHKGGKTIQFIYMPK